jgi:hypothetical protein
MSSTVKVEVRSRVVNVPVEAAEQYFLVAVVLFAVALLLAKMSPLKLPKNPLRWLAAVLHYAAESKSGRYHWVLLAVIGSFCSLLASLLVFLTRAA